MADFAILYTVKRHVVTQTDALKFSEPVTGKFGLSWGVGFRISDDILFRY